MMMRAPPRTRPSPWARRAATFGYLSAHHYVFWRPRARRDRRVQTSSSPSAHQMGYFPRPPSPPRRRCSVRPGRGRRHAARLGTPTRSGSSCAATRRPAADQVIFVMQAGCNRHEGLWPAPTSPPPRCCLSPKAALGGGGHKAESIAPIVEAAMAREGRRPTDARLLRQRGLRRRPRWRAQLRRRGPPLETMVERVPSATAASPTPADRPPLSLVADAPDAFAPDAVPGYGKNAVRTSRIVQPERDARGQPQDVKVGGRRRWFRRRPRHRCRPTSPRASAISAVSSPVSPNENVTRRQAPWAVASGDVLVAAPTDGGVGAVPVSTSCRRRAAPEQQQSPKVPWSNDSPSAGSARR